MINVDRGNWTTDLTSFNHVEIGLNSSKKYLNKLFSLLNSNKINSSLIIYPWPRQIYFGDNFHENYWKNFSLKNNINFFSLYDYFPGSNKNQIILDNFIPGDVHWNKKGNQLIFNAIIESKIFKN